MQYILYPFRNNPIDCDVTIAVTIAVIYFEQQKIKPHLFRYGYYEEKPPILDYLGDSDSLLIFGGTYSDEWLDYYRNICQNISVIDYYRFNFNGMILPNASSTPLSVTTWNLFFPMKPKPEILSYFEVCDIEVFKLIHDRRILKPDPFIFGCCAIINTWINNDELNFSDIACGKWLIEKLQAKTRRVSVKITGDKFKQYNFRRLKRAWRRVQTEPLLSAGEIIYFWTLRLEQSEDDNAIDWLNFIWDMLNFEIKTVRLIRADGVNIFRTNVLDTKMVADKFNGTADMEFVCWLDS
jgi:hypothetical protein